MIRMLAERGVEVILVADGRPYALLEKEFPGLTMIRMPGYLFSYPESGRMAMNMLTWTPSIFLGIYREHRLLQRLISELRPDAVISDNRFGLWSKAIPSVFMTHQVMVKAPPGLRFLEPLLYRINRAFINRYDECWIPDEEGPQNLSGDLGHLRRPPGHACYIGPQSRFRAIHTAPGRMPGHGFLALLSGPEPQRTRLEEILLSQLGDCDTAGIVVRGIPEKTEQQRIGEHHILYSHIETETLARLMQEAEVIISRPGYSTLMDLWALDKMAVFVPTPGQTEQEYLAEYHKDRGRFLFIRQEDFNLKQALRAAASLQVPPSAPHTDLLGPRIDALLARLARTGIS
jgi:hypothetical protein